MSQPEEQPETFIDAALHRTLDVLVQHYGETRVRAALDSWEPGRAALQDASLATFCLPMESRQ